jgi:hypothetical protein
MPGASSAWMKRSADRRCPRLSGGVFLRRTLYGSFPPTTDALPSRRDAREAVKALIVANDFLEAQLEELRTKVSTGYARGRLPPARERKDEADV